MLIIMWFYNEFIKHWLTHNIPVVSNDATVVILILHLSEEWMKMYDERYD